MVVNSKYLGSCIGQVHGDVSVALWQQINPLAF